MTSRPRSGELLEASMERLGFDPTRITRPEPRLLTYYALSAALGLIFFPFIFIPLWIRYRSLRYRIDDEGVAMSWGVLNRREVFLTYRRLQDIQMTRGIIQRKLGLADLHLHTASGSSGAEMKLEGLPDPEAFRDYLYARMRQAGGGGPGGSHPGGATPEAATGTRTGRAGAGGAEAAGAAPGFGRADAARAQGGAPGASATQDEALSLLREIRDELQRLNRRG